MLKPLPENASTKMEGLAEVAVIIVNYNTATLALEAAASVMDRTGGRRAEVHLVDNASPDGDAERIAAEIELRGWTRRITFYPETENHGFGRGNNVVLEALAAREDPPEFVLLLNPDARLENDAITVMADFLDAHPRVAVAGAQIKKPSSGLVSAAFRFPGVASTFAGAVAFGPISRLFSASAIALHPSQPESRVDWVSGAAMMARRSALADVGNFDPVYFLYYEEVDLMRALSNSGWEIWHVPSAKVIHAEGVATGVKSNEAIRRRRPAYWYDSWYYYFHKNHGVVYALFAALAWMLGASMNIMISTLRRRRPVAPLRLFPDLWARVIRPLLGLKAYNNR